MALISITAALLFVAASCLLYLMFKPMRRRDIAMRHLSNALDDLARMHAYLRRRGLVEGWKYYREHGELQSDTLAREMLKDISNESDIQT